MLWLGEGWSDLVRVTPQSNPPWYVNCIKAPGVYRLVGLDKSETPYPKPLNRVCGTDATGTIYIGASDNVSSRIYVLMMQHNPEYKRKNHKAFPARLAEDFSPSRLAVTWRQSDEGIDPFDLENNLINAYRDMFGEIPPLNGQARSYPKRE